MRPISSQKPTANSAGPGRRFMTRWAMIIRPLPLAFSAVLLALGGSMLVGSRAANEEIRWPDSLTGIFGVKKAPAKSVAATSLGEPEPAPFAPLLFWRTDGAAGARPGNNWSTRAPAAGRTGWTNGAHAEFSANWTVTYVSGTRFGNVTVDDGKTVTIPAAGTAS